MKMENFGKFMILLISLIISPIINGYVLVQLWEWFIVSTFDVQPLQLVNGIGILILINFIYAKKSTTTDDVWQELLEAMSFLFVLAAFTLFSGWIVTLFM